MSSDFQFDPDTGLPVSAPDQGFQFDPNTGLPVSSSATQTQPPPPAPAAQPDWWEDYWGPLKDHASQAYHDSLAGNPASMPATDPITAKGLLDGRQALRQEIFAGSDPEADGESKQAAALAATRLAKIDHVLGMMGNQSGDLATGVTKPGDIIDSLTHDKLMASDRYRQVYESASPVLGPEKAADYAKDTVAKDAHFIPYMSDGIFADLMGAPKATAFDKNYRPATPDLPVDVMSEGAAQAAAPEESFLPEVQRAGLGSLGQATMAAAGVLQPALSAVHEAIPALPDASTALFQLADYFGGKADEIKQPDSKVAQLLQMPLSGLTGMFGSDVGREVIKAGGTVEQAQRATAIEAGGGEVSLLIPVLGKTLLGRLFAQSAAAPAVAEAERQARNLNTPDQAEPYSPWQSVMAILGAAPFAFMGGHGEAPRAPEAKIPPALRENFTAAVDEAQKFNQPESMDRLEYIAQQLVSGDKPAMWGAAELNHLTKTGQARDEAGFQQWRDERTAAQVEQPTAAEAAPGEGEQTLEAAQAIVGEPLPPDEHPDAQVPKPTSLAADLTAPVEAPVEAGKQAEIDAAYAQRQQAEQRTRDEQLATAAPDLERLGLSEQDQRLEREHATARAAGMEEEPPPTAMQLAFKKAKVMPRPEPPAPEPLVEGTVTGGEAPTPLEGGPTIEGFRPEVTPPTSPEFQLSGTAMEKGAEVPSKPSFRVDETDDHTQTPEFKQWFGNSKAVDDEGKPLVLYHGTTHEINAFRPRSTNPENDFGRGIYLTNSQEDAGTNYAGEGPDLTSRITQRAEQIASEKDWDYNDPRAYEQARKELSGGKPNIMPLHVKMENPLVLGHDETYLEGTQARRFANSVRKSVEKNILHGSIGREQQIQLGDLYETALDGAPASALIAKAKEVAQYVEDNKGRIVGSDVVRKAIQAAGFDGIIDHTVSKKFGADSGRFNKMDGVDMDTTHYVVFDPTQVKSAIGNRGTFDPNNPDVAFRRAEGEPGRTNGIPTDLPVEKTDASDALERSINYHFTEPGEPQASFAEVRPDSVPHPLSEVLNAAQEFTGTKISIIRDVGPKVTTRWNGMTLREGTLYVNEGTNQPVVHILSHEWTHQLRADAPHLYQQLEDEVNRQGWVDAYAKKFGLNKADALEELTADATGDAMGDPKFLDRMAKENPTVFGRIATAFKNFLGKFLTKYPDLGSHNYMSDAAAFRDKLADVLHQHAAERAARGETIGEPEPAFRRAAEEPPVREGNEVSTRIPSTKGKGPLENPLTHQLNSDVTAMQKDPGQFAHNVSVMGRYAGMAGLDHEGMINRMTRNILYLHDQMPEAVRNRAKQWYDGANNLADKLSQYYNVPRRAVSGVMAVLSPKKDWFMNYSIGHRLIDIMKNHASDAWSPEMETKASQIYAGPKFAADLAEIRGKTLDEVQGDVPKAMWIRTYDEAHNSSAFRILHPEGTFGDFQTNNDGSHTVRTWATTNAIAKAVRIMQDPSIESVSRNLGENHKVRNFYNNIEVPGSLNGHTTIDTHAVAAAHLRPLGISDPEPIHNFGSSVDKELRLVHGNTANSTVHGTNGTYGIYHEAYQRAASARGVLPREMQSITWEGVRGLFPAELKGGMKEKADRIWRLVDDGALTEGEAREKIHELALRAQREPDWVSSAGSHGEVRPDFGPGDVSGTELPGRGSEPTVAGGRGGTAAAVPEPAFRVQPEERRHALFATADPYLRARMAHSADDEPSWGFTRTSSAADRAVGEKLVARYEPTEEMRSALSASGATPVAVNELAPHPENVDKFHAAITASKERNQFGAAVYVYPKEDYAGMRLFTTDDGRSGFAIKPDGDVVSGFTDGGRKMQGMLHLAVEQGGTKADCFDTVLPDLYAINGFRVVRREPWNEAYKPEGWDKKTFADFNHGEPDVVYLEHDPKYNPLEEDPTGTAEPKPAFARAPAEENVAPHSAENEDGAPVKTVKSSIGNLHIETAAGQTRTGTGENGKPFSRVMKHDYGYIEGVPGRDGGSMDVLLGEGAHNPMLPVFVVHQKNNAGGFDEHKVLVGFRNQRDAERAYLSEYPKGWDKMGQVEQFSAAGFKQWARTEGREQAQLGKVDASVPRVNIRGQQPDAVAAFGSTDSPMPQRTANEDGRMDLPNAVKGIASRTVFDPAEAGGKHQAVLRNLYDVKSDPRGLADMARDTLEAHGLPLDLPHMMNEYERLVIAHGFDGYKTSDGKATVLGAKVPMRATEEKTSGLATARPEPGAGRVTERADENAGRDNAPRGEGETTNRANAPEGDNQAAAGKEAGQGVRVPNEPAGAPAHQGVATERTSIKNEETEAIGAGPIERIGGKTADELERGARRALTNNPNLGRDLAAKVSKSPRNISDHEAAVLAVDRQRIVHEHDAATQRTIDAIEANDEESAAAARAAMKLHEDELETNRQATVHAGTEWSNSGRARQMFVAPDESFAGLLAQRKAAAGKSVLSAGERAEIKAHADEIARLKAQVATPGLTEKPPMVAKAAKVKFDDALAQFKKIQSDKLMTKECFL